MRNTDWVFRFHRSSQAEISDQILTAARNSAARPRFLTIENGLEPGDLGPSVHDYSHSCLGCGEEIFAAAKRAFRCWKMFDLAWATVLNANTPIAVGQVVAVEVHPLGLWSVNLSRIMEVVDTETQFGFLYCTTVQHVEQGEEIFLLRFDPATGSVSYELEAVSRPQQALAKIAYPVTRYFQRRFARDSHQRLLGAVGEKDRDVDT